MSNLPNNNLWSLIVAGGFVMYPLVICSLIVWAVIFERFWSFFRISRGLKSFHLEAMNSLLRNDLDALKRQCQQSSQLPTANLILTALDRLGSKDQWLRASWRDALERRRQVLNQELRQNLWLLGTIGSAAPFIGLFGTVVGILRSFQEMARTGAGGFAVVASGISESLVATAAGIVVAVVAVMSFNAFQTRWSHLVLTVRLQMEELAELLDVITERAGPSDGV